MVSWSRVILLVVVTLVLQVAIFVGFHYWEQSLKQNHRREREARLAQWQKEDQEREKKLERAKNEQYGRTPEERAYYNPQVDILQLLSFFAKRNLPKACEADAEVDRFTEFSVFLKCVSLPSADIRAQYLRQILSWVNPQYIFQVAFVEEDGPTIVAEPSCLLKVRNWAAAKNSEIIRACF